MAIENHPLKLEKFKVDTSQNVLYCKGEKTKVDISSYSLPYLLDLQKGSSLSEIILREFQEGRKPKFQELFKVLDLLSYLHLLKEAQGYRYIDRLRPKYHWPQSLLESPLDHISMGPLSGGFLGPLGILLAIVFFFLSVLSFIDWWFFLPSIFELLSTELYLGKVFIILIGSVFSAHFCSSFIDFILKVGRYQSQWAWGLDVSFLGISFQSTMRRPRGIAPWVYVPGLMSSFIVFSVAMMLGLERESLFAVWIGVLLHWLTTLSPFSWTGMTKMLKSTLRCLHENRQEQKVIANNVLLWLTSILRILWVILFGGVLFFILYPFIQFIWLTGVGGEGSLFFSVLILGYLLLFLVSFIEDLAKSVDYRSLQLTEVMNQWLSVEEEEGSLEESSRDFIQNLPFIRLLPSSVREEMLKGKKIIKVRKGVKVCRQGASDRNLYIVIRGSLGVVKKLKRNRQFFVTSLKKGAVFGESGYFLGHRRSADVICEQDSLLLCLKYRKQLAGKELEGDKAQVLRHRIWSVQSMVASPLFKGLPREAMDSILNCGKTVEIAQGVHVINEGDIADAGYFVIQGDLDVVKRGQVINHISLGDFVGEIALLHPGARRTATVVARSDSILMSIEARAFYQLLASNLSLALILDRLSSERLQKN